MTCSTLTVNQLESVSEIRNWALNFHTSTREQFVFLHPVWQQTWWEVFGSQKAPFLFSVERNGKFLLGAPMYISNRTARFIGGQDLTDYNDFLYGSDDGNSDAVSDTLCYIAGNDGIDEIILSSLPEDSPTIAAAEVAAKSMGCGIEVEPEDVAPRLELTDSWDSYLALLSKKHRHELRRKLRRLENHGPTKFLQFSKPSEVSENMKDFITLHKMSDQRKEEFMTPLREKFFHKIAVSMAEEGMTRLCFTEFDGERVAASLCFTSDGVKYLYNSGYNPAYRNLAVGLLNHAINIRSSIEEGFKVFDFLRGNERYKYELGGLDKQIFQVRVRLEALPSA